MDKVDKKLYKHDVELLKLEPYIPLIKEYFGLFVPDLEPELHLAKNNDPGRTYSIIEQVTFEDIQKLFLRYFEEGIENEGQIISLLWLVANLYYGERYKQYQQLWNEEVGEDCLMWPYIRKDIIRLYKLVHGKHASNEAIGLTIGEESVELSNDLKWFYSFLEHHLFPHCIPEIKSVDDAIDELTEKGGRPQSSPEIKGMVCGIARFFYDKGLVSAKAPKNLVLFIKEFVTMMGLLSDPLTKQVVNENWIKARIHKLDGPQLDNLDFESCNLEDLGASQQEIAFRWLFPPESLFGDKG